jgi:hypothetical protein
MAAKVQVEEGTQSAGTLIYQSQALSDSLYITLPHINRKAEVKEHTKNLHSRRKI